MNCLGRAYQSPRSQFVHCSGMNPMLKKIGICLLIVVGLIFIAVMRALSNILKRS